MNINFIKVLKTLNHSFRMNSIHEIKNEVEMFVSFTFIQYVWHWCDCFAELNITI
jgi:hypothetical protein